MQRLRPLTESECYCRCYGWVGTTGDVRVLGRSGGRETGGDRDRPVVQDERLRTHDRRAA